MNLTQDLRAWVDERSITAQALDGRIPKEVYADYAEWARSKDLPIHAYGDWLQSIAVQNRLMGLLPTLTLETREADNGCPQTYFATMAVD